MGAGNTVSQVGNGIGGVVSMIPGYGTLIGGAISGISTLVGGALEASEAEKQKQQAEKVRADALRTQAQKIQPEYLQKLRMDKAAALNGLPGLEYDKSQLNTQSANTARSIRESSPTGAATLAAMSAAKGLENNSLMDILAKNDAYKAKALENLSQTVGGIGGEKQALQDKADAVKMRGLQAASALEAAGTYNKMNGINKILGAVGSTAASLGKTGGNDSNQSLIEHLVKNGIDEAQAKKIADGYMVNSPLVPTVEQNPEWNTGNNTLGADISISNAAASPYALNNWK